MGYVPDKEIIGNMKGFVILEKFLRGEGLRSFKGISEEQIEFLRGKYNAVNPAKFASKPDFNAVLNQHVLKRQLPKNIISFKYPRSGT